MPVKFDTTGLDAVRIKMLGLRSLSLSVGVQGAKGRKRYIAVGRLRSGNRFSTIGPSVAAVALFNEFGTEDIPARSFIRGALFEARAKIEAFIAKVMERFIASPKADALSALSKIGHHIVGHIKHRINTTTRWATPNAAATVAAKGHSRPLHDREILSKAITWVVRGPGGVTLAEGT